MICAILLAAGASTRTTLPKPLYPIGGVPLVVYQIERLLESGVDQVIVVVGYHAEAVRAAIGERERVRTVCNPLPQEGMFSSLCTAIAAAPREGRILIHPVDVPLAAERCLERLYAAEAPIVIPVCEGRKGHPVLIEASLARTIPFCGVERLDRWLEGHREMSLLIPLEDPSIVYNGNTDAELARYFRNGEL